MKPVSEVTLRYVARIKVLIGSLVYLYSNSSIWLMCEVGEVK